MLTCTERDEVYRVAVYTLQKSSWGTHGSERPLQIPSSAKWIDCAIQNNEYACGFHTIFNGWAAALGLKVNPEFRKDWTNFRTEAADVVSLAIIGKATVKLIKDFFDCSQFILPGQDVHKARQFHKTTRVFRGLGQSLDDILNDSLVQLQARGSIATPGKIPRNRIVMRNGRPHNTTWPCDKWKERRDLNYHFAMEELSQKGFLEPTMDHRRLKHALQMFSGEYRLIQPHETDAGELLQHFLETQGQGMTNPAYELVNRWHDYLRIYDCLDLQTINEEPCRVFSQNKKYYAELNKRIEKREFFQVADVANNNGDFGGLEWSELFACIAAVVQAVDTHQHRQCKSAVFTGGFSIASSRSLQRAIIAQDDESDPPRVSRPRRCWLLPYELTGKSARGHHVAHSFLAVLQEEKSKRGGDNKFCVYFLDSRPEHLERRKVEIYDNIKQIAQALSWTTQGNKNGRAYFCASPKFVKVTTQRPGVNACSDHTVLNAWILALGLTPALGGNSTLPQVMLRELRQMMNLSLTGSMDWKTLVAWLFCRKLTIEQRAELVPESRRFRQTASQTIRSQNTANLADVDWFYDRTSLDDYISSLGNPDQSGIAWMPDGTCPYDYSTNVDFSRDGFHMDTEEDDEEEEVNEEDEEPDHLNRADDDMDDLVYMDSWSNLQYYQDLAQRKWEERKYQERCARRNRWLRQLRVQRRPLGIRR
jgi:hypothetical protein